MVLLAPFRPTSSANVATLLTAHPSLHTLLNPPSFQLASNSAHGAAQESTQEQGAGLAELGGSPWRLVVSAEGENYYHNVQTNETSWEPPSPSRMLLGTDVGTEDGRGGEGGWEGDEQGQSQDQGQEGLTGGLTPAVELNRMRRTQPIRAAHAGLMGTLPGSGSESQSGSSSGAGSGIEAPRAVTDESGGAAGASIAPAVPLATTGPDSAGGLNLASQLRELRDLREEGVLDEAEFTKAKRALLDK